MTITVHYQTQVKRATGCASEVVELDDGSLRQLVHVLAVRHGDAFGRLVVRHDGAPHESILWFIGERQVTPTETVALRDGDVVTLLAPMAGG